MGRHVFKLQEQGEYQKINLISNYIEEETPYEKMVSWWTQQGYPGTFNEELYKKICDERKRKKKL
jgi:hypothetical protein